MSRNINPVPQYLDDAGNPLPLGKVYYFESNTDTPKVTYADVNLSIPNTHPVLLSGSGRLLNVFFTGTARQKLTNANDVQIWDRDPVDGSDMGGNFEPWVPQVIYNKNDIVEGSDGAFYLSFVDGNENNDPTTSPSFWQEIEFINVWNEFVSYLIGDTVKASDNNFYKSLIEPNLGNDPTTTPSAWGSPVDIDLSSPGPIGEGIPDTAKFTEVVLTAISDIVAADIDIIDHAIFGPATESFDWSVAAPHSDFMLVTVSHNGTPATDMTVRIYDLTVADFALLESVVIPTVNLVTAIAAQSCYISVATKQGVLVIDPKSGAWAQQFNGWPKSLDATTFPALADNDVQNIGAGYANVPTRDDFTGGDMPTWAISLGTGAAKGNLINDNGEVFSLAGTVNGGAAIITNGKISISDGGGGNRLDVSISPIEGITGDNWATSSVGGSASVEMPGLGFDNDGSAFRDQIAGAGALGHTLAFGLSATEVSPFLNDGSGTVKITRAYNSLFMANEPVGAWLANSVTADVSGQGNTLTENGIVPLAAVETGAELEAAGPFSTVNFLDAADNADWNARGNGALAWEYWFNTAVGIIASQEHVSLGDAAFTWRFTTFMSLTSGIINAVETGAGGTVTISTPGGFDDGEWHKVNFVRASNVERYLYVDGRLEVSDTTDTGSLTSIGNWPLHIGIAADQTSRPAETTRISSAHLTTTAPTAEDVLTAYYFETPAFRANALCLLQSATTDEVLRARFDPSTGKTAVTQVDAAVIFNGAAIESTIALPAASFKSNVLSGGTLATLSNINEVVSLPAKNVRGVLDDFENLKAELGNNPDLGEAKAWVVLDGTGTISVLHQFNVQSIIDNGTGNYTVTWSRPAKEQNYPAALSSSQNSIKVVGTVQQQTVQVAVEDAAGAAVDADYVAIVMYGELA